MSEKTIRNWLAAGRLSAEKSADGFHIPVEALAPFRRHSARTPHPADPSADPIRADSAESTASTVNPQALTVADVLQLVREAQAEAIAKAEAAAMWQARAEVLQAELERLRLPALPAGELATVDSPQAPRPWWARLAWWRSY